MGIPEPPLTFFQSVAFKITCLYLISHLINDWSIRLLGEQAYLSLIAGVMLPFVCLFTGDPLRGLKSPMGRWWAGYLFFLILAIPMSYWRGGSFQVIKEFTLKNYPILFYVACTALTIRQCKNLYYVMAAGGAAVVASCFFFGDSSSGRLLIERSIFFDNSNDLALQLLISSAFLLLLILSKRMSLKIIGSGLLVVAVIYLLETGSRANFISFMVCVAALFILTPHKGRFMFAGICIALLAAVTVTPERWSRLVYIVWSADEEEDLRAGDLESQLQRTELFKRSLVLTAKNPVVGIGPGQFAEVVWAEAKKEGQRIASLGTHNTYTQVSSEAGIPALICYLGVSFGALFTTLRLYRKTRNDPQWEDISKLSLCIFLALLAYSVSTLFHHVAYSRQLPTLAGIALALSMAAFRVLRQQAPAPQEPRLGN